MKKAAARSQEWARVDKAIDKLEIVVDRARQFVDQLEGVRDEVEDALAELNYKEAE
jgi:hypothetical protein